MRFSSKREMKHTKIEIIPMIDTMFFLLVFFILASLNIIDLRGLNLDLPEANPGRQQNPQKDPVKLEIAIDKDGNKTINGSVKVPFNKSATPELIESMQKQLGGRPTPELLAKLTVTIAPDPDTAHENVIHAVDDARGAKIEKFQIR